MKKFLAILTILVTNLSIAENAPLKAEIGDLIVSKDSDTSSSSWLPNDKHMIYDYTCISGECNIVFGGENPVANIVSYRELTDEEKSFQSELDPNEKYIAFDNAPFISLKGDLATDPKALQYFNFARKNYNKYNALIENIPLASNVHFERDTIKDTAAISFYVLNEDSNPMSLPLAQGEQQWKKYSIPVDLDDFDAAKLLENFDKLAKSAKPTSTRSNPTYVSEEQRMAAGKEASLHGVEVLNLPLAYAQKADLNKDGFVSHQESTVAEVLFSAEAALEVGDFKTDPTMQNDNSVSYENKEIMQKVLRGHLNEYNELKAPIEEVQIGFPKKYSGKEED